MLTATVNGNQTVIPGVDLSEDATEANKPNRKGNSLMKRLEPDFLSNPHPLEILDGIMSDHFCFEKCSKLIAEQLEFQTEKEWLAFAKQVWHWQQEAETRRKEVAAAAILQQIESDPKLLEILKQKLQTIAP